MLLIHEWRIAIWIIAVLRPFVSSLPSVVSLACGHCGFSIGARKKDGISSYAFEIDSHQQKQSHCKHVVVVTLDGNLSISCVRSRSDEHRSDQDSGNDDGISFTRENLGDA